MKIALCAALAGLTLSGCVTVTKKVVSSVPPSPALPSSACPGTGALGPAYDAPVRQGAVDQALLDGAVLHYTNVKRCERGLSPLSADPALRVAATGHSSDMAREGFFAHDSPVPGKASLRERLNGANVSFSSAAENIAFNSRMQLDARRDFYAIDRANCQFTHVKGSGPLPPHSYRTLARKFVDDWENSAGHRENLFNPAFRRLGTGGATAPNAVNCGDVYVTQNFAS